jgi:hypothetical protein
MKIRKLVGKLPLSGLAVAILALAIASPALAAGSASVETYGGAGGETQANIQGGGGGGSTSPSARGSLRSARGALPFTGTDLALALAGGLVLFAAGVAMARLGSRPTRRITDAAGASGGKIAGRT